MTMSLREWRKAKGRTLDDVAAELEVEASMVSKWERGIVMPKLPSAQKILKMTKNQVTLEDLIRTAEPDED